MRYLDCDCLVVTALHLHSKYHTLSVLNSSEFSCSFSSLCSTDTATESNSVDDNIPTAEEATEATEVNAGTGEDPADIAQTGVYTEHVFTDPLGVQNTTEASPVYQPRYIVETYTS